MTGLVEIGQKYFNDRYEIYGYIGKGGFGKVYKAFQLTGQTNTVAIKFLQGKSDAYSKAFESLRQEGLVLGRLSDSNVVKIIALEQDDNNLAIVMEYLAGSSLSQLILENHKKNKKQKTIGPKQVASIGSRLASGLEFIHGQGVIHGDIKPSNIIFRDDTITNPVWVDFAHGILEENEEIKNARDEQAVTLTYLPPERTGFLKENGDRRSDLYSLGICLYELACGSPPYQSADKNKMINLIMSELPRPLPNIIPDFPEPLWDVIQRLLRKNPSDRYQTAMGAFWDLKHCADTLNSSKKIKPFALGRKDQLSELNYKIKIVGRKEELKKLNNSFGNSLKGQPQTCLIAAPSGLGKSRLATELTSTAKKKNYRILYAKFSKFETNLPLAAIMHACIDHVESISKLGESAVKEWTDQLLNHLGSSGTLIKDRLHQLGVDLPEFPPLKPLSPEEESAVLISALAEFMTIGSDSAEGTLIFLDDLQWADRKSAEVIAELVNLCKSNWTKNLFFLGTYRSNEVNDSHLLSDIVLPRLDHENCHLINLNPLSEKEWGLLVSQLLDEDNDQVNKLKTVVYNCAKGNPFYTYEILKTLISREIYHPDPKGSSWLYNEEKEKQINLEAELSGLVKERIGKLSKNANSLLRLTSIAGTTVNDEILQLIWIDKSLRSMESDSKRTLENSLKELKLAKEELLRNHFIKETNGGFSFFHDKIREAAYSLLDPEARSHLHDIIGIYRAKDILACKRDQKTSTNDFFETAFHIVNSAKPSSPDVAKEFLYLAAQSAIKVFAYTKAQEFLKKASELFPQDLDAKDFDAWILIHELLADTLAVSESVDQALKLYDQVLEKTKDPVHIAKIYSKKAEYNLSLFRYKVSLESAKLGLGIFNLHLIDDEKMSIIRTVLKAPFFVVFIIFYHLIGKYLPKKELKGDANITQCKLWINVLPPAFFTKPFTAIEMVIPLTVKHIFYKPNEYRQLMIGYWGIACAALGLRKISNKCFAESYRYFERNPHPINKAFVSMTWGYVNLFPDGELVRAKDKMMEALDGFEGVGEKFWRFITLQGLSQLDWYGLSNDDAKECVPRAVYIWEKTQFEPSAMGSVASLAFLNNDKTRMEYWLKKVNQAAIDVEQLGFESIDSVYANLAPGELYFLTKNYEKALPLLKKAYKITKSHFHRVAFCNYAPVLYSRCAIRVGQRRAALKAILFSWANVFTGIKSFLPQTLYATGEWLYQGGLEILGLIAIRSGIKVARAKKYTSVEADGKYLLGELYATKESDLDLAEYNFLSARDSYKKLGYNPLAEQCEFELNQIKTRLQNMEDTVETTITRTKFREEVETHALLEIFLKLSSLKKTEDLLDGIMEALCACKGSESAIVYFPFVE